jgi:phosphatidylserine/phosphatidylglycerophosphate/cardiolipin synthase-like enzyme
MRPLLTLSSLSVSLAALVACNAPPSEADLAATRGAPVEVYFNDPGSRQETVWKSDAVKIMVDLIDQARSTIRFAVMGFSHDPVIEAMVRAYDRGVTVEMVGDAGHLTNDGYQWFRDRHIPITVGNQAHIMHDKFMVVDDRFVFASTSNWTDSDLQQNSNNFAMIDNPFVAADFTAEHQQMFQGVFGNNKIEIDNGRVYEMGDTTVEVWFAPNEDAMGRILELVDGAEESVKFTIFAFTKDQLGGALIRKQEELVRKGIATPGDPTYGVAGVIDQSQLHSNGQYHEAYRMLGAGIPLRMDGNNAESQPGDYQAGGGRLHSKTLIIDALGDEPAVISGSFNWSASATQSNDEFLLVFRGPRVAEEFDQYFSYLWDNARRFGLEHVGENGLEPGDVVIDEVHWYGAHANDIDGQDEFLELRNRTDRDLRIDMWQVAGVDDFVVGIPPGSILPARGRFAIVDHVLEAYQDGAPQDTNTAFLGGDLVLNAFNDNRQARLYLKDEALELRLLDADANVLDVVGDGGPAFAGGPDGGVVRSMQRNDDPGDGSEPGNWHASRVSQGGSLVNPAPIVPGESRTYRETILATPGEPEGD